MLKHESTKKHEVHERGSFLGDELVSFRGLRGVSCSSCFNDQAVYVDSGGFGAIGDAEA